MKGHAPCKAHHRKIALPIRSRTAFITTPQSQRRIRNFFRKIRAIWHDTSALMQEFRLSILGFILVTVLGGFIYGELYLLAYDERIPLIDRPYIMLQLMVLETPHDIPAEWFLMLFWYLLPPTFVLLAGLGAADFVRLFFFRDQRSNAWREAVASTYRDHIIVLGAGHVGTRVVRELAHMGFDIVVLDNDPDPGVEETLQALDVPLIVDDGRNSLVLEKAGLRYADAFLACTGNDHVNLEAVMKVRDMNPHVRIVSRMWDDQYSTHLHQFLNVETVLSSSDLAAPVFAGATVGVEITQTLQIHGQDYSMIRITVEAGSFLDGKEIGTLQAENGMDIVLHSHDSSNVHVQPDRNVVVRAGDTLVIFARHDRILSVVNRNRRRGKRQILPPA